MKFNKEEINFKDISVVVQGPITGKATDKIENRHTYVCLKSIRKILPGATIILSTWENADIADLDYDHVIQSKDPGYFKLWDYIPNVLRNDSSNRQIVSTMNGLKLCKTKFSIKMRSDLIFKSSNFLDYYEKFNNLPFDMDYKILKQRVVALTTINPHRRFKHPFSMCDWFIFGLTEDLMNIFDIPLITEETLKGEKNGNYFSVTNNYSTEQYFWFAFLSKYRKIPFHNFIDTTNNNIETSEKYFANNCILLSARRAGLDCLKYPGASYAQIPCLSYSGLYTYNEYKRLLNTYANNHLIIIPNIFEIVTYFIVYNLRFYVKQKNPKIHDFITTLVNPKNHKK